MIKKKERERKRILMIIASTCGVLARHKLLHSIFSITLCVNYYYFNCIDKKVETQGRVSERDSIQNDLVYRGSALYQDSYMRTERRGIEVKMTNYNCFSHFCFRDI